MSFLRVYPTQMLLSVDWMARPKSLVILTCQNTWSFKCLFNPNVIYFLCGMLRQDVFIGVKIWNLRMLEWALVCLTGCCASFNDCFMKDITEILVNSGHKINWLNVDLNCKLIICMSACPPKRSYKVTNNLITVCVQHLHKTVYIYIYFFF